MQQFELKSHTMLSDMKAEINEMHAKTGKTYIKMEELMRELDKRIREFKERGGKYDPNDTVDTLYTMMDAILRQDMRRSKLVGDEKAMRAYIIQEAAESRETHL